MVEMTALNALSRLYERPDMNGAVIIGEMRKRYGFKARSLHAEEQKPDLKTA